VDLLIYSVASSLAGLACASSLDSIDYPMTPPGRGPSRGRGGTEIRAPASHARLAWGWLDYSVDRESFHLWFGSASIAEARPVRSRAPSALRPLRPGAGSAGPARQGRSRP
jgi:hypothetical protein